MLRYIIKRLLMIIPVILGVLTIVFVLSEITPGDPVTLLLGSEVTEEVREAKAAELGLDQPVYVKYYHYVVNFFTKGDLGTSYQTKQPVWTEIRERLPFTLKLGLISLLLATVIALPIGVISAIRQYSWVDNSAMLLALIFISIPSFWLGLLMIRQFSVELGWLPSYGISSWKSWIMPVIVLGISSSASITRITRSSMLEVVRQDYIRTAQAKGQKEGTVIIRHGFRNALIPIVTAIGNQMGVAFGGTVMIESVFALPGLGKYMTDAINQRNWPAIQGGVIWLAIAFSVVNLLVDLLYVWIDPRLQSRYKGVRAKELRRLRKQMAQNRTVVN